MSLGFTCLQECRIPTFLHWSKHLKKLSSIVRFNRKLLSADHPMVHPHNDTSGGHILLLPLASATPASHSLNLHHTLLWYRGQRAVLESSQPIRFFSSTSSNQYFHWPRNWGRQLNFHFLKTHSLELISISYNIAEACSIYDKFNPSLARIFNSPRIINCHLPKNFINCDQSYGKAFSSTLFVLALIEERRVGSKTRKTW